MTVDGPSLLDPAFLAQLGQLTLRARRRFAGRVVGEKKTPRTGSGLEFADHRDYVAGDDLRHLDWALLGRLDRPYVKQFEQDAALTVHLVVDGSASMAFGQPAKFFTASRIAAALAHVALASLDRVGVTVLGAGSRSGGASRTVGFATHGPVRGRGGLFSLLRFLDAAKADGASDVEQGLRLHAAASRPGLTVVLSDFLEPEPERFFRAHRFRGHTMVLVQLLAPEELDPPYDGDLRLVDAETERAVEISVGRRERQAYQARLTAHRERLRQHAVRSGVELFHFSSATPLEEILWTRLLRGFFLTRG